MRPIDTYFLEQKEPVKSCLQFLRDHLLHLSAEVTESWQYGMPFYYYKGRRFCYLWVHKKHQQPYIGIVDGKQIDHPGLLQEKRARMKIFLIDPDIDIPIEPINELLEKVLALYRTEA